MTIEVLSLGCRLNFAEAEAMRGLAPAGGQWLIVNSCAVTNEAVRQSRQAIRRARRRSPETRILVTGCAAELDPGGFRSMPEVDRVVGNRDKLPTGIVPAGSSSRVRSFVAVQTGCDHRCTFCSIWQARGPSQSLPFEPIRDAIAMELDRGAKEIVLTGVDITSYACPEPGRGDGGLGTLCQRLLEAVPRLQRLRLSSLDGVEIDDALFELMGDRRLLPHFHLSLQSGDDLILKRMKRRHGRAQAVRLIERIKAIRADATVGADLIAGFPTETEEMARNSLKLIDDCDIVAAHIFPFSPRPNTPAARMPQVDPQLIKARASRLREAAVRRRRAWLECLVGTKQTVLIENEARGHADNNAPVAIAGARRGDIGTAEVVGCDGDILQAAWT